MKDWAFIQDIVNSKPEDGNPDFKVDPALALVSLIFTRWKQQSSPTTPRPEDFIIRRADTPTTFSPSTFSPAPTSPIPYNRSDESLSQRDTVTPAPTQPLKTSSEPVAPPPTSPTTLPPPTTTPTTTNPPTASPQLTQPIQQPSPQLHDLPAQPKDITLLKQKIRTRSGDILDEEVIAEVMQWERRRDNLQTKMDVLMKKKTARINSYNSLTSL